MRFREPIISAVVAAVLGYATYSAAGAGQPLPETFRPQDQMGCERKRESARFSLDYKGAYLDQILQTISDATCKTFVRGEEVAAEPVTLTTREVSSEQLYAEFVQALEARALKIVLAGEEHRIRHIQQDEPSRRGAQFFEPLNGAKCIDDGRARPKERVTVSYRNADLARFLVDQANRTCQHFVLSPDVHASITLDLSGVTASELYHEFLKKLAEQRLRVMVVFGEYRVERIGSTKSEIPGSEVFVPPPKSQCEKFGDEKFFTLKYTDADLGEVLAVVGNWTCKRFVLPPDIRPSITLTSGNVSSATLYAEFVRQLREQGLRVVVAGDEHRIERSP